MILVGLFIILDSVLPSLPPVFCELTSLAVALALDFW